MSSDRDNVAKSVAALAAAGIRVRSAWDLADAAVLDPAAVPVLIDLLPELIPGRESEGVVRTLERDDARDRRLVDALVSELERPEYRDPERPLAGVGWAVGNAIGTKAGDKQFDRIRELILDARLDAKRKMLTRALGRCKKHRAETAAVLVELLRRAELVGNVLEVLKRTALLTTLDPSARGELAALTEAVIAEKPTPWIRRSAEACLAGLAKLGVALPAPAAAPARGNRVRILEAPRNRQDRMSYSSNFDTAGLGALLERIVARTDGALARQDAAGIIEVVNTMALDQEITFEVPIGSAETLELTVLLDDEEAPDVEFRSTPELIGITAAEHRRLS